MKSQFVTSWNEANTALGGLSPRLVFGNQSLDGIEDHGKLLVVFVFQRVIAIFTSTARGERRMLDSMATPCSVKA
jgi:hypothetical protein